MTYSSLTTGAAVKQLLRDRGHETPRYWSIAKPPPYRPETARRGLAVRQVAAILSGYGHDPVDVREMVAYMLGLGELAASRATGRICVGRDAGRRTDRHFAQSAMMASHEPDMRHGAAWWS